VGKSPRMARMESPPAPAYTRPGATRTPSYRAPESSQPRIIAPSASQAPSVRVQPAPSVSRSEAGRSAPASSGKSENASRPATARSSGESRGGNR
jgi:hypothetical protein